ncbi:MAG: hypothetical protein KDB77_06445 [Flavobacteriales bacterium]|nr:hypothetical protein [Flavobacteriales bacterium]
MDPQNDPMTAPAWNFHLDMLSDEDLKTCIVYVEERRLPDSQELASLPRDRSYWPGSLEESLIELAALFAHEVLRPPHPSLGPVGLFGVAEGRLPDNVDVDRYDGVNAGNEGGINLYESYVDFGLEALAPILKKYPFRP